MIPVMWVNKILVNLKWCIDMGSYFLSLVLSSVLNHFILGRAEFPRVTIKALECKVLLRCKCNESNMCEKEISSITTESCFSQLN